MLLQFLLLFKPSIITSKHPFQTETTQDIPPQKDLDHVLITQKASVGQGKENNGKEDDSRPGRETLGDPAAGSEDKRIGGGSLLGLNDSLWDSTAA